MTCVPMPKVLATRASPFAWNEERRFLLRAELTLHSFFIFICQPRKDGTWQECQKKTPPNTGS